MKLDGQVNLSRLAPGSVVFGRFRLRSLLGVGGMGVVWRAHDEEVGMDLALKFIGAEWQRDVSALEGLKRETRRGMAMSHPHIVRVYGYYAGNGHAAVAMEFVEGNTLAQLRAASATHFFEAEELHDWLRQTIEALQYAHHELGLVHRDLKPSNLMIGPRGQLKVADFGIAGRVSGEWTQAGPAVAGVGTTAFASPRQLQGQAPCATQDIYGLGATLYDLLTGKPPFFTGDILAQVKDSVPPSVMDRRRELWGQVGQPLPSRWESVIAACLSKDDALRPATVRAVGEMLGLYGDQPEVRSGAPRSSPPAYKPAPAELATVRSLEEPVAEPVVEPKRVPRKRTWPWAKFKWALIAGGLAGVAALLHKQSSPGVTGSGVGPSGLGDVAGLHSLGADADLPGGLSTGGDRGGKGRQLPPGGIAPVAKGKLRVRTQPAGASVSVDGVALPESAEQRLSLPIGTHAVQLEKPGYLPIKKTVDILADVENELGPLVLDVGTSPLEVMTEPAGLPVSVASHKLAAEDLEQVKREALSPFTWQRLPWGKYQVKVVDVNKVEKTTEVELVPGRLARADLKLIRVRVEVQGFPEGLKVRVDQRVVGYTPLKLLLPVGPTTLDVERNGKPRQVFNLQLIEGVAMQVTPEFQVTGEVLH